MIVLDGADLVLPDRVVSGGSLVIEDDRIRSIDSPPQAIDAAARLELHDHYVMPGFIDVHIHGLEGSDVLEGREAIHAVAARLPRYGVTAFCPTTVACDPVTLGRFLDGVSALRADRPAGTARVLPAHLESNFINPQFKGAQPAECLRLPRRDSHASTEPQTGFSAFEILELMTGRTHDIGIVTLAPELPGAIDLIRQLTAAGVLVSLGHSAASFEESMAAIEAGARHATHLFNRMAPLHHRDPGLAGAVLSSGEIAAEVIADGRHVHPAMVRATIAAKEPSRVMAITDATAVAGLGNGARAAQGRRTVTARNGVAWLDDGTMAGGAATMDEVFGVLVASAGLSLVDAATVCSTTPASELKLTNVGLIAPGRLADLVVLDRQFRVRHTFLGGRAIYSA